MKQSIYSKLYTVKGYAEEREPRQLGRLGKVPIKK